MMRNQRRGAGRTSGNSPKSTTRETSSSDRPKRNSGKSFKSKGNTGKSSKESPSSRRFSSSKRKEEPPFDKRKRTSRTENGENFSSKSLRSEKNFSDNRDSGKPAKRNDFKKDNYKGQKYKQESSEFRKKSFSRERNDGFKKPGGYSTETARKKTTVKKEKEGEGEEIRLNKYIANAGFCSRREADTYIQTGVVTVNGEIITELGYKIKPGDRVLFGGKPVIGEKPVYILLNKPKDYITTSKDPQNRRTVFDLISGVKERVFAVGRLDRNTTGLLLLTNDGELADKLMHPRKKVVKIYHVELDRKFTHAHLEQLQNGITLEDGFFKPDDVAFVEGMDKKHIGIEIHSGKNRIVRRLFEHLGYKVVKLDRVLYAGLTKKGIPRGEWRYLKPKEVGMLKML
jgi:23S rRNA pseudouridine2605 synthase